MKGRYFLESDEILRLYGGGIVLPEEPSLIAFEKVVDGLKDYGIFLDSKREEKQ